jgi:hypothetical protein
MKVTGILSQTVELELPDDAFAYPSPEAISFNGVDEVIVDLSINDRISKFTHYPTVIIQVLVENGQMEPYNAPYRVIRGSDNLPATITVQTSGLTGVIVLKR